jgi:hypothetical protein
MTDKQPIIHVALAVLFGERNLTKKDKEIGLRV